MENPKTDIVDKVLRYILSTDMPSVLNVIDKYVADDVDFHHPFFLLHGKQEFIRLYKGWSSQNKSFNYVNVHAVFYDEALKRCVTDITYQFKPLCFPTSQPQTARVISIFHLRGETHNGVTKYKITSQEDLYPTAAIAAACTPAIFSLPQVTRSTVTGLLRLNGYFMISVFAPFSQLVSYAAEAIGWKVPTFDKQIVMETIEDEPVARKNL
ncbi:hypothetical protein BDZ88DRAFT_425184 [Geranomyces variabilis]|nr:hypothetical protein BDZ88DRAFT_425184 [Geranomyces variabilis]KAJ3143713.1 hypothetical protein HDU90_000478 [Geranomyces variabilis]